MTTKTRIEDPGPKYWKVALNAHDKGRGYVVTRIIGVTAHDALSAIQGALEVYPGATVVNVLYEGPIDVVVGVSTITEEA